MGCYNDNQQMLNLASDENFLTSETKIWSFARYEDRIEIMCDGKLLITISFKEECQELWSSVPIAVTFQAMDSASTSYRAEPKEGETLTTLIAPKKQESFLGTTTYLARGGRVRPSAEGIAHYP